jgi:hypothetical protein
VPVIPFWSVNASSSSSGAKPAVAVPVSSSGISSSSPGWLTVNLMVAPLSSVESASTTKKPASTGRGPSFST